MNLLGHPVVENFAWALVHFLWQGMLIYVALWLILAAMRRASADIRYLILCGGMAVMAICPVATLAWTWPNTMPTTVVSTPVSNQDRFTPSAIDNPVPRGPIPHEGEDLGPTVAELTEPDDSALSPSVAAPSGRPISDRWHLLLQRFASCLAAVWFAGVCVLSLRLVVAWQWVYTLRCRSTSLVPRIWQCRLDELASRLRVKRPVVLVQSALVNVPTIIGWLKPLILLPSAALTGLDPEQLESLLAHELAHVRRHDYLVNLVQTMIETLLFYHPVVWWLSRRIRKEREDCCDDLAIAVCGDRMTYARALATMEAMKSSSSLMLAANGNSLKSRIQRILSVPGEHSSASRRSLVPSATAVVSLVGLYVATMVVIATSWHVAEGNPVSASKATDDAPAKSASDVPEDGDRSDSTWKSFLANLRKQESRFHTYSAKVRTTREFGRPKNREASGVSLKRNAPATFSVQSDGPSLVSTISVTQQIVKGRLFRMNGEDTVVYSTDEQVSDKRLVVCNGQKTVAIDEGRSTTIYAGRAEPPQMMPPHCWGIFHLEVSFPLSVYLEGTDAMRAHPKVGRHPQEAGSIHEFGRVEAAIVGNETVDGLDCTLILVKRWYYSNDPPMNQYLWVAKDRNSHVIQTRTSFLQNGIEVPRQESRVTRWRMIPNDIWLPDIVEVVEISPEAVTNKTTANVVNRLTLESAEWNPRLPDNEFRLPEIADTLPRFEVSAENRLIAGPLQPVPLSVQSTTLEAIIDRLAEEEKKYNPCELITESRYSHLNMQQGMEGVVLKSQTRQRNVIKGAKKYFEEEQQTVSQSGKSSSNQRHADDGNIRRSTSTSMDQGVTQNWASVDLGRGNRGFKRFAAEELLNVPHGLSGYLKSGSFDESQQISMTVEYVGDERIGELTCHKLKCDLKNNYFCLWLERDRNLLPVRHEWYEPRWNATLPTGIKVAEDLREIGPKLWFPRHCTELAFQKSSRDGLNVNRIALQWRRETTVERIALEPAVENRLFSELMVPEGTQVNVYDERSQRVGQYSAKSAEQLEVTPAKLLELKEEATKANDPIAETVVTENQTVKFVPTRDRGDSDAGKLLNRLEQLNAGQAIFRDGWMRTMKEIVELGSDAVPELIEELDTTDNDRMLRCLGFIVRAINDKRAVPALIRAIPKTLRKPGSDMGLSIVDPELVKFARQHEIDQIAKNKWVDFGRPVREISVALQKLTGQQFNEQAVFGVFLNGMPPEWRQQRQRYYQVAKTWADWWENHWSELVDDENYQLVRLSPLTLSSAPRQGAVVETIGEKTGLILQSVLNPKSVNAFYDIDTDRFAPVPDKWRESGEIESHLSEIVAWAQTEGFDLMGTEYPATTPVGEPVFAIRGVGLRSWELDPDRWKSPRDVVTLESLTEGRNLITGLLLRRNPDQASQVADPKATATFLVTTAEGTPALLHVGVEVQDDRPKPGHFFVGVPELNPVATTKGRRFSVMYFNEVEQRP